MKTLQTNIKRIALATAVAMATLSAAPAAMAQSHHGSHDYNRNGRYDRQDQRVDKARERAYRDYRHDQRRAYNQQRKDYRRWARGQYIPRDYLGSRYYINDYRTYRLAPPPRGYVWVRPYRDDGTYYMVQLATGLIAQALIR